MTDGLVKCMGVLFIFGCLGFFGTKTQRQEKGRTTDRLVKCMDVPFIFSRAAGVGCWGEAPAHYWFIFF